MQSKPPSQAFPHHGGTSWMFHIALWIIQALSWLLAHQNFLQTPRTHGQFSSSYLSLLLQLAAAIPLSTSTKPLSMSQIWLKSDSLDFCVWLFLLQSNPPVPSTLSQIIGLGSVYGCTVLNFAYIHVLYPRAGRRTHRPFTFLPILDVLKYMWECGLLFNM